MDDARTSTTPRDANWAQGQRVAKHALKRTDRATLNELRDYLRDAK